MTITSHFRPLQVGPYVLTNRLVMAPMTRSRATEDGVPTALMSLYYEQRASAGLIISEGIFPSPMGKGYVRTPGLHNDSQVAGWRHVTDAVHARGGRIFAQLMHVGRISLPEFLPDRATPVAPSVVTPRGQVFTDVGMKPWGAPRALALEEIPGVIAEFRAATERAFEAGFDGVELHAASGYLPEQFLSSGTNLRTDRYGGSVAGRLRFVLETLQAISSVRGPEYVGIKIAPEMRYNDIVDADPKATYRRLVLELNDLRLAYLHVADTVDGRPWHQLLRPMYSGVYLAGAGFDAATAADWIDAGRADAIVHGQAFIANPDLPERISAGAPLSPVQAEGLYSGGARGFVDYPTMQASALAG